MSVQNNRAAPLTRNYQLLSPVKLFMVHVVGERVHFEYIKYLFIRIPTERFGSMCAAFAVSIDAARGLSTDGSRGADHSGDTGVDGTLTMVSGVQRTIDH